MKARSTRQPRRPSPALHVASGGSGLIPAAGLVLLAFLVYAPALRAGFIWDDEALTANPCVTSVTGLWKIWFSPSRMPQEHHYWPLVYTTFWLEHRLVGLRPFLYHLDNILLHGAVSLLLWRVLARLAVPGAWLGAALFAVHPIHAESVAWIVERKDVLSGVFFFAAALAFLRCGMRNAECGIQNSEYGRPNTIPPEGGTTNWAWYVLSFVLFVAALLSKSIAIGLPFALGLALWWRDGRLTRRDLRALLPLVAIAAGLTLADLRGYHKSQLGAFENSGLSLTERVLLASGSLWVYLAKLAWPWPLATFYAKWNINPGEYLSWLPAIAGLGLAGGLWFSRKRIGRGPLAAAAFYALMLAPVLGLVAFDFQTFSWIADRFQYLASAGPLALAAAALTLLARRRHWPAARVRLGAGVLLGGLGLLCFAQASLYRDSIALFRASSAREPHCWAAYNNLAFALAQSGRGGEAVTVLREGLRAMHAPDYRMTLELAEHLARARQFAEAERYYRNTLDLKPDFAGGMLLYASFLAERGRDDDAEAQYRNALGSGRDNTIALFNLGNLLRRQNKLAEAERYFNRAVELEPAVAIFRLNLALALADQKKYPQAAAQCAQILKIDPNHLEAQLMSGQILLVQQNYPEAIAHLEQARRLQPQAAQTHALLGMAHQALNHKDEAIGCYREALRLQPDHAEAARGLQSLGVAP